MIRVVAYLAALIWCAAGIAFTLPGLCFLAVATAFVVLLVDTAIYLKGQPDD